LVLVLVNLEHDRAVFRVKRKLGLGPLLRLIDTIQVNTGLKIESNVVALKQLEDAALSLVDCFADEGRSRILWKQVAKTVRTKLVVFPVSKHCTEMIVRRPVARAQQIGFACCAL
jgi:hypothetical protein